MPNTRQAAKRLRQDAKRRVTNRAYASRMKTEIKKFETHLSEGNLDGAKAVLPQAYKRIDKCAKKRVIHPNNANRKKARLARQLARAAAG